MSEPTSIAPDPGGLGERFLSAFNDIEARVRHDGPRKESLGKLSRAFLARRGLLQHVDALTDFVELRNTLVHGRHFTSGLLATPAPEVVAEIEKLRDLVVAPPRALDVLTSHDVITCTPDDEIGDVLEVVAEHGFSVVPVIAGGRVLGAVTSHALARWLAHVWSKPGPVPSVRVGTVLRYARDTDAVVVLRPEATVADVVAALGASVDATVGAGAAAVLVAHDPARPLAIATAGDLPRLTRVLSLND